MVGESARTASDVAAHAARGDLRLEARLCDPGFNPHAAAYFIFNYCLTQDEERGGAVEYLPAPFHPADTPSTPWHEPGGPSYVLRWIRTLDAPRPCPITGRNEPHNVHDEKSRRMLHTWVAMHYNLWALMFVRGYSSLLISKSEDHVDDGGKNPKVFSMFGRMRFSWERLPDHVRKHVDFTYMSATCRENDSFSMGRAPTKDAGRGGGFVRVFVDEAAHLEWADAIHIAIDPACKFGKVYMSTVNGTTNLFARIKKARPRGWRFEECDWKEEPRHTVGIRATEGELERDRYGDFVSDWFVGATASLDDEGIGQEYGRNYQRSKKGRILREFRRDVHVRPKGVLLYDPTLEVRVGLDFGMERKTAGVIGQFAGGRKLRVIGAYAGAHRNAPDNAEGLVQRIHALTGLYPPDYTTKHGDARVVLVPDPSAANEESGSGIPPLSWYQTAGFVHWVYPRVVGPGSVTQGNRILRWALRNGMVEFAAECEELEADFFDALSNYRLPIDPKTGEIRSNVPVHDMTSHYADGFRYLATSEWVGNFDRSGDVFTPLGASPQASRLEPSVLDDDDEDDLAPAGLPMRPFPRTRGGYA